MLSVIMLNAVMLSVVILNVMVLKAAASYCPQAAACICDMFLQLLFCKNRIIAKKSTIIKATKKHSFGILRIL
jgi:hypothetical protein